MIKLFFLITIFISVQNRDYDPINKIQGILLQSIKNDLYLNFTINGTNDLSYNFISENIYYKFGRTFVDDKLKKILIFNSYIRILFNLNVYEYSNRICDFSSKNIKYSENIQVDIKFSKLIFIKKYADFSFEFIYEVNDFFNDISIYYENMDKINLFKYLLFEDKNDTYNNTLDDSIKMNIIQNFDKEIEKMLVYYPECDSLYFFNLIIEYFKNELIELNERIYQVGYKDFIINTCKITSFDFKEIIKENRTIIYKDINTTMTIATYLEDPDDYEEESIDISTRTVYIEYISIDENFKVNYGKINNDNDVYLEALKLVVKKSEETLKKNENK